MSLPLPGKRLWPHPAASAGAPFTTRTRPSEARELSWLLVMLDGYLPGDAASGASRLTVRAFRCSRAPHTSLVGTGRLFVDVQMKAHDFQPVKHPLLRALDLRQYGISRPLDGKSCRQRSFTATRAGSGRIETGLVQSAGRNAGPQLGAGKPARLITIQKLFDGGGDQESPQIIVGASDDLQANRQAIHILSDRQDKCR